MTTTCYKKRDVERAFNSEKFRKSPNLISLWDRDIRLTHATDRMLVASGYKVDASFVGKSNFDMRSHAVNSAAEFERQFRKVFTTCRLLTTVDIHTYTDRTRVQLTQLMPVIDNNGNLTSALCERKDFAGIEAVIIGSQIINGFERFLYRNMPISLSLEIIERYDLLGLTKAESLCFYYVTRGLTDKQAAQKLKRSIRTVQEHVGNIKCKVGCRQRAEFSDLAIALGLTNLIPSGLVSRL
jgi:DNA-binding CsgD family transcriptional regulator